ncbi:SDR family NAD(P)-dependent oxidoreductase [Herbiconiux sp. P17]|uniref:SDR family NAD(P)-dependent oxidoreductase n=1 Tax=Herbiconiux wuyangfengii TaxID=3342794 RepID=UPI0035BB5F2F
MSEMQGGQGDGDDRGEPGDRVGVAGRRVVVAGATSASGQATCGALADAGAQVVALGSNAGRLDELALRVPGIATEVCDLTDSSAVDTLALRLSASGPVDGLVHLVGGWVGGRGISGQTDDGWTTVEASFRTLRNTTRAFYPALVASDEGRVAFVSSTSVDAPTASGADYTAAKAASESWMRSLAHGFRTDQGESELHSAAVVFVVKALVDDRMRAAAPEKTFPGYTEVDTLAAAVVGLWDAPAGELDGARIRLP